MNINEIKIRTEIRPGDLGYVIYRHGKLYGDEYNYGISFETYVGLGLHEFYKNYDTDKDRVWICEHDDKIIGFVLLMHRDNNTAQLRYFYLEPEYRGIGLGKKLMGLFMNFLKKKKYHSAYLWTTDELDTAVSIYTKYGFEITESKQSTAFEKPLNEVRYDLKNIN